MQAKKPSIYRPELKVRSFLLVILFSGLAYGFYRGIQDNYLAEIIKITKFERGIVEFFRELPGLMLIFILAAMYRFSETKVFKIGTAIMLAGVVGLLLLGTSKVMVILCMVIFSSGEHIVMPMKSSLSMKHAKPGKGGASLGITSAISHGGNIVGYLIVTALFLVFASLGVPRGSLVGFRTVFIIAAVLLFLSFLIALSMKDQGKTVKRNRIYFNKKFTKYYMLEVFYGARKQIFLTFAPYVLILYYGADTSVIALLLAICAGFGMVFSPLIGRLIDHLGYKTIMVGDTLILMVVCFFYGFAHRIFPKDIAFIVVCVNFVLDSIISLASMASNVYVQDLSTSPEETTATLTTGISVNHLISVIIALLGGLIWEKLGIEVLFTLSGFLGLMNTFYAMTIKKPIRQEEALA
ncbi:MFS transporter [Sphaerochaeta sp. PS]|uniref:MFS transporter n=1 Tax=Sphaerochaeta sp. PS TaxID=3076336 RepID=UPI0028A55D7D|nr:MFS transporter [Sphaerochaeta sp. PS]MDT4761715.1 MFS transporter [Sphaerochaeta sp. PS]